jgi:hypothetical protein
VSRNDDGLVTRSKKFQPDPDGDPCKFHIDIMDEDGETVATVQHHTRGGDRPLSGLIAKRAEHNAQVIVDALNADNAGRPYGRNLR